MQKKQLFELNHWINKLMQPALPCGRNNMILSQIGLNVDSMEIFSVIL